MMNGFKMFGNGSQVNLYPCFIILLLTLIGAEEAAKDDGMVSMPLDLGYMGVYTVWMNILGNPNLIFTFENNTNNP